MRKAQNVNLHSVPTQYALKCLPIYHLKLVLCNFLPQAPSCHNPDFPRLQKPQHQAHRAVLEPLACWDLTRGQPRVLWGADVPPPVLGDATTFLAAEDQA